MPYHHTELIRLLEQRNHIFPSDPASITEILRQADGTPEAKLHRRAQLQHGSSSGCSAHTN